MRRTHPPASAHHASKASKPPSPEHEFPTTPLASGLRGAGGGAVENSATVVSNVPRCLLRHLNAGLENHSHATETLFPRTDLRLVPKLGAHNRTREIRISDLAVGHGLTSNRMVTVRKRYGSTPA